MQALYRAESVAISICFNPLHYDNKINKTNRQLLQSANRFAFEGTRKPMHTLKGGEFQTDGATKLNERSLAKGFQKINLKNEFLKASSSRIRRRVREV